MSEPRFDGLVASHWTLAGVIPPAPPRFPFAARVAAAARAGFTGIGLRFDDYEACGAAGLGGAAMRAILTEHGVSVVEMEMVYGWASDDAAERAKARHLEEVLLDAADALGGRQIHVGQEVAGLPPLAPVVERFGALCDRAAAHGVLVALAFTPWSGIPDARVAAAIVRGAGRPNGGVLIDTWHHFRGARDPEAIRAIGAANVIGVQLNDADAEPVGPLREDGRHRRRLPGEGAFDLVGFVRLLDEIGVRAPFAVEVMSEAQAALPLDEAARRAYETTQALLARARAPS
jgi:sugar phosphate isomerase/epimerase